MRRSRGGFTIIEVMIFLVISGALLIGAMAAVNGQQNRTEFTQAMRDIDSKLQDTFNDVSNGNFTYNNNNCTIDPATSRPVLSGSGPGIGSRSACLFLGEAVQFGAQGSTAGVPNNTRFAIYTVLGRRLMPSISGSVSVNSFTEANPTVMNAAGHDLTSYYDYGQGITAKAIFYTPTSGSAPPGAYTLLGLFTSFTSAAGNIGVSDADASQALQTYVYRLGDNTPYGAGAKNCIDNSSCPFDSTLSSVGGSHGLGICFDSNNGTNQTALITIYNTTEGVNTKLEYNPAGAAC